jgi:hypothetical protein
MFLNTINLGLFSIFIRVLLGNIVFRHFVGMYFSPV